MVLWKGDVVLEKVRENEELQDTKSPLSLHDQYQNTNIDAAKWNSANINYITCISAFRTVEAFVWNCPCWIWFNSIVQKHCFCPAYIQPWLSSWLSASLINIDSPFANVPLLNSAHVWQEKEPQDENRTALWFPSLLECHKKKMNFLKLCAAHRFPPASISPAYLPRFCFFFSSCTKTHAHTQTHGNMRAVCWWSAIHSMRDLLFPW